jgi:D-serine deaminase-like pyridoxal phosphate-dependent protein
MAYSITQLDTPCLLLSLPRLQRNVQRMANALSGNNARFRPHLKSAKCAEVAKIVTEQHFGGITVSTLKEAEYFAGSGFTDILYAVAIIPARFERAARLIEGGTKLQLLLDDPEVATALNAFATARGLHVHILLEIDSDGHRNGLTPDDPRLAAIAQNLAGSDHVTIDGVLTHAGESYGQDTAAGIRAVAAQEAEVTVWCAHMLRQMGHAAPIVSIGSTPTALFNIAHPEVTEYRAGVYMFMDLFQSNLGLCAHDDIAVTVLSSVIGHAAAHDRILIDAGGLALSKDRGTGRQARDYGYGLVRMADDRAKTPDNPIVTDANQEHGLVAWDKSQLPPPIGAHVHVLPNHVCMTVSAHDRYFVTDEQGNVIDEWHRISGW